MNQEVALRIFEYITLVLAFCVHECVHSYAAFRLGDPTAYMLGRVTMNPAKQLDPWGSFVMPAFSLFFGGGAMVGWGRPTPITLRNFKKIKRDDVLSTCAGLFSFLGSALIAVILLVVLKHTIGASAIVAAVAMVNHVEIDTTNLPRLFPVALLLYFIVVTNVLLFVFNLIPVPPLDGGRLIRNYLPYNVEKMYDRIGMLGSFLIFFVAGRIVFPIFYPPLISLFNGLLASL